MKVVDNLASSENAEPASGAAQAGDAPQPDPDGELRGFTVMLVDDDPMMVEIVQTFLEEAGYSNFVTTSDPTAGVGLAREHRPDVIFLDFVMPSMTAFEVLDELKPDPETRKIPVIVNTAKNLDEQERRRLAQDTAAILSKQSISRELAISRIREALANALRPATAEPQGA